MYKEAQMVFEEMEAARISVDTVACGALLMVLNNGGHPEETLSFGKSIRSRGIRFDNICYTEILAACYKYGLLVMNVPVLVD